MCQALFQELVARAGEVVSERLLPSHTTLGEVGLGGGGGEEAFSS